MKIEDQLKQLSSSNPKLSEILDACPFDDQKNIGGKLTQDVFFEKLYFENDIYISKKVELRRKLTNSVMNNRVLFLHGFSGIGKTTFIRSFVNSNSDIDHRVIDFQEYIPFLPENYNQTQLENPIISSLKQYLQDEKTVSTYQLISLFHSIDNHIGVLKKYLPKMYLLFKDKRINVKSLSYAEIVDIITTLDFNDTFIVFFLYLFHDRNRRRYSDNICVIYFDNLDTIKLEYLSDRFKRRLPNILAKINQLAIEDEIFDTEKIDFSRKYKFIFCLRDANNAQINSNNYDRLWSNTVDLEIKLMFNSDLYKRVILKRIEFAPEVCQYNEFDGLSIKKENIEEIIQVLMNDYVFNKILLPLYNYDLRKLVISIYWMMFNSKIISDDFIKQYRLVPHGVRGRLIFGIIKQLATDNFIELFTKVPLPRDYEGGYCHPIRVILNVLLNLCNSRINMLSPIIKPAKSNI